MTDDQNKVSFENEELEKVTQTKFLGLVTDDKIEWLKVYVKATKMLIFSFAIYVIQLWNVLYKPILKIIHVFTSK